MKDSFVSCTDLHITNKCPKIRTDDYFATQMIKFTLLCETASRSALHLLVCAGDFFDSVKSVSYENLEEIIDIIRKYDLTLLTTAGQHDQRFHDLNLINTPLSLLAK